MKPLCFLHGWGQSQQVWCRQKPYYSDAMFINLPGHGGTKNTADWQEEIMSQLPDHGSILIAWSLGGLLAMQIALTSPHKVAALVLVGASPSFCMQKNWKHGCEDVLFTHFYAGAKAQASKTLYRFFSLMLHGDDLDRATVNLLRKEAIDQSTQANAQTLTQGLDLLAASDIRSHLAKIQRPTLIMHGTHDAIVPLAAGNYLAKHLPQTEMVTFDHCGHAPFLSQSEHFNHTLEKWCENI
ncbi:MAG: alpha/beta fold hydrolase [Mariprofundaceae bacterium]